jgi:MerR family transcriptional regulator, heat shock protein HspR
MSEEPEVAARPPLAGPEKGVFSIAVAAELSGLHPQTMRSYEREGFLEPERSAGGTRRYSSDDIRRMQAIAVLTAEGLNLAGVRRVLDLEQEVRELREEVAALRREVANQLR